MSKPEWHSKPVGSRLDDPAVLACVSESLPGGAATTKSRAYWQWKHIDNAFGTSTGTCACSDASGEIVGVRCFMRWKFHDPGGAEVPAVRAVDTATSPDWRGQGVFTGMTRAAIEYLREEGTELIFNTPNAASAPGYRKMGWRPIGRVPLFVRPLRPFRMARRLLSGRDRAASSADAADLGVGALPGWSEFAGEGDADAVIDSHERARAASGLRTPRNRAYLDWRYGRHPQADYRVQAIHENGRLTAFVVVRPNRRFGLGELVLVDMWAHDAHRRHLVNCLRALKQACGADYMIAHARPGSVEHAALRSALFLPAPGQGMSLHARAVGPALPAGTERLDGWDLSLGDLELF